MEFQTRTGRRTFGPAGRRRRVAWSQLKTSPEQLRSLSPQPGRKRRANCVFRHRASPPARTINFKGIRVGMGDSALGPDTESGRGCRPLVAGCCDSAATLALISSFAFLSLTSKHPARGGGQLRLEGPRSGRNAAGVLLSKAAARPPTHMQPPRDPTRGAAGEEEAFPRSFPVYSHLGG